MVKKARKRGGWPKRDRTAITLRIDPEVAEWYTKAAAESGRSRNAFMETWLFILRRVMAEMEAGFEGDAEPYGVLEQAGWRLVRLLIDSGYATPVLREGWKLFLAEREARERAIQERSK